jgi:hypothetical protein
MMSPYSIRVFADLNQIARISAPFADAISRGTVLAIVPNIRMSLTHNGIETVRFQSGKWAEGLQPRPWYYRNNLS